MLHIIKTTTNHFSFYSIEFEAYMSLLTTKSNGPFNGNKSAGDGEGGIRLKVVYFSPELRGFFLGDWGGPKNGSRCVAKCVILKGQNSLTIKYRRLNRCLNNLKMDIICWKISCLRWPFLLRGKHYLFGWAL